MFLMENEEESFDSQVCTSEITAEFSKEDLVNALIAVNAAQIDSDIGWIQIYFSETGNIVFSASSHHLSIRYEINTPHVGHGIINVSGRQFSEYVKQLPNATVYLKAELPYKINLKCAGSSAKIQLVQDQTLNVVKPSKVGTCITVKGSFLEQWVNTFKDLVLVEDSRFFANGALIWVDAENGEYRLYSVASDALRLSKSCLTEGFEVQSTDSGQVLVPKRTLEELKRECSAQPNKNFILKWSKDELSFSIECDGYLLSSKCIAGVYPPYEAAFPQTINFEIAFDLKAMQESIRRTLMFTDKNKVVKLTFENSLLKMASFTPGLKEGEEVIEIQPPVETPFEINYNAYQLAGILNVITGSRVHFYWESTQKPVRIIGEEQRGLNVFYLLVPSRF